MSSAVMSLLVQRFRLGDPGKATDRDRKLADGISRLLQLHDAGENLELEELEPILEHVSDNEDDEDSLVESEEPPDAEKIVCVEFSRGQLVDTKTVRAALEFYRMQSHPQPVYRPLSIVKGKFNFIQNHHDLSILRRFAEVEEFATPPPEPVAVDYVEFSQGCVVDTKTVKAALDFYRIKCSPPLYRPLSIVMEKFKFIQNRHDLAILRGFAETEEFATAPAPPEPAKVDYVEFSRGRLVDTKTVRAALEFYRIQSSPQPVYRPLSAVTERFNFVQSHHDLSILRRFEITDEQMTCRDTQLRILRKTLLERVRAKMNTGLVLRDRDIQAMARDLSRDMGLNDFNACISWVRKFRRMFSLSQPHVLKPPSRQLLERESLSLATSQAHPTTR